MTWENNLERLNIFKECRSVKLTEDALGRELILWLNNKAKEHGVHVNKVALAILRAAMKEDPKRKEI